MEEKRGDPNLGLVNKIEKRRSIKIFFIWFIAFILLLILIFFGFLVYDHYKNQPIQTGENIEAFIFGEDESQLYAKIKDFPSNCSGIKFILSVRWDKEYFCYVNSTPANIQFLSSGAETETFDYKVPASCFGLDDFSTISEINAVYLISNLSVKNNTTLQNPINITRIFNRTTGSSNGGEGDDDEDDDEDDCTPSCSGKICGNNGCGGTCGSCSAGYDCVSGSCNLSTHIYIIKSNFDNVIYNITSLRDGVNSSGMEVFNGFAGLINGASANYYVENYSIAKFYVIVGQFNHTITYDEFSRNYLSLYFNESLADIDTYAIQVSEIFEFNASGSGYMLITSYFPAPGYLKVIWASGSKIFYLNLEPFDVIEDQVNEDSFMDILDAYEEKHIADLIFLTICNDSDNGRDYYNANFTQVYLQGHEWALDSTSDYCVYNSQLLSEKYCENNTMQEDMYSCPVWCFDGKCVNESMYLKCEDTESEINYSIKGNVSLIFNRTGEVYLSNQDYCLGNPKGNISMPLIADYLIDYYCEGDSIIGADYNCRQEDKLCLDGACTSMICIDSDGGINKNLYGEVYSKFGDEERTNNDSCISVGYSIVVFKNESLTIYNQTEYCPNPVDQTEALLGDCVITSYDEVSSCNDSDCYIHEKYCLELDSGIYDADADEEIFCHNGCLDGGCIKICNDSDTGLDYYTFGAVSENQEIFFSETVRGADEIIVYNANNAYIIPLNLNVSLGGQYSTYLGVFNITEINFYSEGSIENNIIIGYTTLNDVCLNSSDLIERVCNPGDSGDSEVIYTCSNGCLNGVCSESVPSLSLWTRLIEWIKHLF